MIKYVVTHPGGAHKDDFLACSLLVSKYGVSVFRREPTVEDVADSSIAVVDVGGEHNEEMNNFDHHQFPRDHGEVCALTLVLQHLGLYEDAKIFCDWLETTEWMDTRGPVDTAEWLGVDRTAMAKLNSPIDMTLLRRFAMGDNYHKGDVMWEVMKMIGDDMISFVTSMKEKLEFLKKYVSFETINDDEGDEVAILPRVAGVPDDISSGMIRYILMLNRESVVALVYPDRRGTGYGLSRMNDSKKMEYTRISEEEDVHFALNRGFIAKTTATDLDRLLELVRKSYQQN